MNTSNYYYEYENKKESKQINLVKVNEPTTIKPSTTEYQSYADSKMNSNFNEHKMHSHISFNDEYYGSNNHINIAKL